MVEPVVKQRVAESVRRYWWLFLVRGLLGLALGVFAIAFPGATLVVTVTFIGAYLIVDGLVASAKAFQVMRSDTRWWILLLEGILGIAVGIAIFAWPGISILSLAYLVSYWAIFSGVAAVATAFRLRTHVPGEWLYMLFGVISVIFGLFVLFSPATGLFYIVFMISIYGFVMGITMLALAFRARSLPVGPKP